MSFSVSSLRTPLDLLLKSKVPVEDFVANSEVRFVIFSLNLRYKKFPLTGLVLFVESELTGLRGKSGNTGRGQR